MSSPVRRLAFAATLILILAPMILRGQAPTFNPAQPASLGGDAIPDIVIGTGDGGGLVRALSGVDGRELVSGFPFGPTFTGGVRVAAGDLTGDGVADVIVGMGTGGGQVRVFHGTSAALITSLSPFGSGFTGGVYVAAGDVTNDGVADIIVGQGEGGGLVRVYNGQTLGEVAAGAPFGADFVGGVTVALGDVNADGRVDYVVGTAVGGLVRVFDGATIAPLGAGFPYGPLYLGGVDVAAGDLNGDGFAEVVTAQRGAVSPAVSIFDVRVPALISSFSPFPDADGVRVAMGDLNGDGRAELITGSGLGGTPRLRVFDGASRAELMSGVVFDPLFRGGVFVTTTVSGGTGLRFTSPTAATFTAGTPGSFTITTRGTGTRTIRLAAGPLPTGVSFTDNGDGTATLAGTPAPGTGGTYPLIFRAGPGAGIAQNVVLTVNEAPAITSANTTTMIVNVASTFTVSTTGFPGRTLSVTGALPAGVTFTSSNSTGTLAGTPAAGSAGVYPLTITATNGVGSAAAQSFTLVVHSAPSITSANTTTFTAGSANSFTITTSGIPTVSGITRGGTLPTGVTFTNNGDGTATLAGVPATGTAGTYPLTFTATNGVGTPASQTFSLVVAANSTPIITSSASATFTVGAAGSFLITTTANPTVTSISRSGVLPSGVIFTDNGNGTATLTGTPAAGTDGAYPLQFSATNGSGTATQNFTLTVNPIGGGEPVITSANTTTFVIGTAGAFTVTSTGTPAATIGVTGAFPSGVTFTNNGDGTATIAGTAAPGTAGLYPLTFTATNSQGTASQSFTLNVNTISTTPVFTSATSTTFRIGTAGTFAITTSASPAVTAITLTGTPPSGVSFTDNGNGTATLAGTPTAGAGLHSLTFSATNGVGGPVTQSFSLHIQQAAAITSANAASFNVGAPGTFTITSVGTPTPTITQSGTLPSGITFTDQGTGTASLSGTAAVGTAGAYPITITATNGVGTAGTQTFTLTIIGNNPPTIDAIASPAPIDEDAPQQTVNLTGITAGAGETQALQVTASSGNTALIPNPTVTYTSPNATGSLSYTPVASTSGTAIITVAVRDAGLNGIPGDGDDLTTTRTFVVAVNSVNDAPTLNAIANPAAIDEDAAQQTINLTGITAGVGETQDLQVTALSNNIALIPNPSVTYTTPNATGSIAYTPVANQSGSAVITVTVRDAGDDGTLGNGDDASFSRNVTVVVNPINDQPTLNAIANPAPIDEDSGQQTRSVSGISAGGGESQALTVTATSDTIALIPNPTVTYASPNTTALLAYTPVANANGSAIITVTVRDAGLDGTPGNGDDGTITRTFTVVVNPMPEPPTLDAIPDPAPINEDAGQQTVNLTGISAGIGEGTQQLQVTATSATTSLIPNPTVTYTSPNATGSLAYTPVANASGSALITVTVTDGGPDNVIGTGGDDQTVQRTFTVVVNPINDVPTLDAIPDPAAIDEDAAQQTVTLTGIAAGGGETQALTVTATSNNTALIPNPTVTYTSPNAGGSLAYTPVADAFGSAVITVTVRDAGLDGTPGNVDDATTVRTFTVVVNSATEPPTLDVIPNPAAINEDAGQQTVNLTGITPGAGDAGQALAVTATSNNTGLIPNPTVTYTSPNATGSLAYTPVANQSGSAIITVTVTDGGTDLVVGTGGDDQTVQRTFTVVVNPVNDAPVANNDTFLVNEGGALNIVAPGLLVNDTDIDGGALTTQLVAGPSNASSFTLNADGSFSYQHNGSESPLTDSFTYRVSDTAALSNVATVTITINPVNDGPVIDLDADNSGGTTGVNYAVAFTEGDPTTLIEDQADATVTDADDTTLMSLTVTLTNLLDPTFETLSVDLTGFPGFTAPFDTSTAGVGVLTISAGSAQPIASFQSLLRTVRYINTDQNPDGTARTITFVANDGTSNGPAATTTVTLTPVNDPPTADNESYNVQNGGTLNVPAATGVLNGDVDVEGATLTAVLNAGPANASSFTLNADGSFVYTHNGGGSTTDSFTYFANDGAVNSNLATVTFSINAAPVAVDDSGTTNEDTVLTAPGPGVLANDTDADVGDTLSVSAVNGVPANVSVAITLGSGATLTLNGNGSYSYDPTAVAAFQSLGAGQTAIDTFTYAVQDNGGLQDTGLVTITINGVNDAPVVTTTGGNTAFTEDGGAVTVDAGLVVTDVDAAPLNSATITITNLLDAGVETLAAPTLLGGATANYVAPTLTISGSATVAEYQTMLRAVTYNNTSQNPNQIARSIAFVVNDGLVNSNTANKTVTVAAVNDAPVVTTNAGTTAFIEDGGAVIVDANVTVVDPDNAQLAAAQVVIVSPPDGAAEALGFNAGSCAGLSVTPAGFPVGTTLNITGNQSPAVYQTCFRSVTYNNTSNNPNTATRTITFSASDGLVGGTSPAVGRSVSVTPANDPPTLTTPTISYATVGHTQLHVEGKTLPGVTSIADATGADAKAGPFVDPDGPAAPTIVDAAGASANGGSFDIDPDGSFTYVPPLNFTGTDSFTFQVSDGVTAAVGTVDITVTHLVWYVTDVIDANNAAGGDGRSNNALESLSTAITNSNAAAGNADYIYVFAGNTAATPLPGGIDLPDGTKLLGQGVDLDLAGFPDVVVATTQPRIRTTAASTNAVNVTATTGVRQNIEIRGLDLEATGGTSNAIDVTVSSPHVVGVTISNVTITGATAEGIDVNHSSTGSSTIALSNLTVTSTGTAIDLNEAAGTLTVTGFSGLTVSGNSTGAGIAVTNATFDTAAGAPYNQVAGGNMAIGVAGNPVGGAGLVLTNVTGDLAFTDLDIFSTGGAGGLFVTGTGAVNVAAGTGTRVSVAAGVATLESTSGPAVDINNATIDLPLSAVTVNGSGTTGISLVNVNDGTSAAAFSATSGSITNTGGTAFNVSGGNATISYGGTITQGNNAAAVSVANGHTDTITFSGTVGATNGTGLQFNNADGTYNFTGTTTLNGADAGIDILNGSTGTFSFGANTTITNPTNTAFTLSASDANVTYSGSITDNTGLVVDIDDHNAGTVTFQTGNITSTGTGLRVANSNGGTINFNSPNISLTTGAVAAVTLDTNNTGGTINFNAGGTGLDITTTSGTGFSSLGGGIITVQGTGNSISTTTGTALVISSTQVGNGGANGVQFNSVTTNGAANGILLTSVTQGASSTGVDILGGSIVNASTRGVDIASSSADVTVSLSISSTGTGRTVEVTDAGRNVVGGSQIVFSGAIDENGLGINLDNNDQNTNGAVISFSGGLDIDSTTNTGFNATNGGTVNVTGGANTIDTTTGTALNVTSTTIGASGLTFVSISANGGTNGIVLSNTGSVGLTVTGDGTLARNGSGGTITNKTGDGIQLTNANNVSLRSMNLTTNGTNPPTLADASGTSGSHTIEVNGGSNLILSGVLISGTRGTGLLVLNLGGTNRLNNATRFQATLASAGHNVYVNNTNTNMTLFDLDGVQMVDNNASSTNFFFSNTGSSNMSLTVRNGSLFEDLGTQALTLAAGGTGVATTGTLTTSVIGNTFRNGKAVGGVNIGENNVGVLVNSGATHVSLVQSNLFDNIAEDGTVANTSIVRTQNSGGIMQATVTSNTIQNIDYTTGGRHAIGHVFEPVAFSAANSSTLVFSNNTISAITYTLTNREAIFIDYRPTASGGAVTVQGNNVNLPSAGSQQAVELRFRQTNASNVNVLVRGNTITHNTAASFLDVDAEDGAQVQLTIDGGNNFTNSNATPGQTIAVATEDPVAAGGPSSMCVSITGNTLQGGAGTITLDELAGTMTVTQASAAAIAGANGIPGGNVTVSGSPLFGQPACTVP